MRECGMTEGLDGVEFCEKEWSDGLPLAFH